MSVIIDQKTQKYDRQLRLWATNGQKALEDANICLLNVSTTGCEMVKNLVLPGAGHVTIIDDSEVTKEDIQNNFFLDKDSTGQSKANSAAALLQELNEDAKVDYLEKNPEVLIDQSPGYFESFSLIIAVNMRDEYLSKLAQLCQQFGKVLFTIKSKGLVGMFSVQAPEHTIIESHPENTVDLRLACPFKQLVDYVATIDLDKMDQTDHSHVPFVVVILKYVEAWKAKHDGKAPQNYQERQELIKDIRAGMRTPEEENFEEAISHVWRLSNSDTISSEIRHLFEDPACQNATSNSPYFWILTRALRDFVRNEGEGQLPLAGKLLDMKSDTLNYVNLQKVYREKASQDLEAITQRVNELVQGSSIVIPKETIELFCKNAANIRVIHYQNLSENNLKKEQLVNLLKNEENFCYYFVFKAADKFQTIYGRLPATESDFDNLKANVTSLMESLGVSTEEMGEIATSEMLNRVLTNYVRFNDLETANLAALLGGLAAQEAIKLLTHQYIPINNTCIFNGILSTSSVYKL
ncbi:Appbp1-Uba3-Nedd8, an E1-ubiquitin-like protein complex with Atp [Mycotypha africana]|uniref:Appbp1-Uba3-Nedd8, an E1-ubiquitin-like protein complex with Atp n=1 Tax=Mycotypha africana TaxID=64632 RepID=UPI002301CCEF|nr:Appbp1-Uba3-Nedd8, an E1-ubiquitin-like protein complex with Atp [Mycotypha africana]KAI8984578.1 Appbp1-Uba3-Nedd8, an E1-ubiquitin-like protein complex with Atp [Mycotypha africana]